MENQSTNNNTDKPVENKIVCRKCGGPHFTIKCGKEKQPAEQTDNNTQSVKKDFRENKNSGDSSNRHYDSSNRHYDSSNRHYDSNNRHHDSNNRHHDSNNRHHDSNNRHYERKPYFKTTYRVKIGDLPTDITEEEMMELTCDWGHIVRIRVNNYHESSNAYVDFGYEEEADYFVKAIDKTPFDYLIISAQRVESFRPKEST